MDKINLDQAKELLNSGMSEAKKLIDDPKRIDQLLQQLEEKLKDVPTVGTVLADIPLMISMVKAYITKTYTVVSPKVIVSLLSAFVYMVKKQDLINDNIPVIGMVDDIAVIGLVLKLNEPELEAYKKWREENKDKVEKIEQS